MAEEKNIQETEVALVSEQTFETVIKPKNGWFDLHLKEVWGYKDLILLFVKRNFVSQYKQTILGPAWAVIQPLLTTVVFTLVFGNIAGLAPSGVNSFVYYLCGTVFWQYFASCLTMTSSTFTANSNIFGKVYFPRLVLPLSTVITNLISLGIQFVFFIIAWAIFLFKPGEMIQPGLQIAIVPVMVIMEALLALGFGIIVSALTTKYRDLAMLVGFGVQLWMYATPVAYSASMFNGSRFEILYWCNPTTPIIETIRYAFLGPEVAEFRPLFLLISACTTVVVLFVGIILFSRVEKTFMDTV